MVFNFQIWCKECTSRYQKTDKKGKASVRKHLLKQRGIAPEYINLAMKIRNRTRRRCDICNMPESDLRPLRLDHDHDNGRPRGLLCSRCNIGLGYYEHWYLENKIKITSYLNKYINK